MTPKLQQIMDLLKTMLEDIRIDNIARVRRNGEEVHYNSDLGANIVEWKVTPFPDETVEGITFRDAGSINTETQNKYHQQDLNIEIEIIAGTSGTLTPAKLRLLHQDVNWAIGKNPKFKGADGLNLAVKTHPVSKDNQIDQDKKVVGGSLLKYKVTYVTEEWEI